MSMNWLMGVNSHADESSKPQAAPVFAGQKLVVVGGSSGMGRLSGTSTAASWPAVTDQPGPPGHRSNHPDTSPVPVRRRNPHG